MAHFRHPARLRAAFAITAVLALAACEGGLDLDFRDLANSRADTSDAARRATGPRPEPDVRGVISYPNYQVAIARRGDTVGDVARRIGLTPEELARFNGVQSGDTLREGEVLALPRRISQPISTVPSPGAVDVTTLAGDAISQAEARTGAGAPPPNVPGTGVEPIRHQVSRGETAFSIARLYNVSVRALAEWNGLGSDLTVREGQFLLIPVAAPLEIVQAPGEDTTAPGEGSPTPTPPSAIQPLPEDAPPSPAAATPPAPTPDLGGTRTEASDSGARLAYPVQGSIIRAFNPATNQGINIGAPAGTPVTAADDGTVAAITRDTDQVPILVLRHSGGLLTVYANVDNLKVEKDDSVRRGQAIAEVRDTDPPFVHFEVRDGLDAVDPMPFLE